MYVLVDDVDVDVTRQSRRGVSAGMYIPMLTELGQFHFTTPSIAYEFVENSIRFR